MEKPVASSAASIEDTSLEGTRTPSLKEKQEEAEFDGSALAKQLSTVVEAHRKQSTDVEKTATEVQADPQVRQIRGFKVSRTKYL